MNTLDIIIAIPILWGLFKGFRRGFIVEISTLLALVLGVYGALTFGDLGADYIHRQFNTDPGISRVLGFALLFIVIVVAVYLLGKALEKLIQMVALGLVNKLFGMLFGGLKWALIVGSVLYVVSSIPLTNNWLGKDRQRDSYLYLPMLKILPAIYPIVTSPEWREDIERNLEKVKEDVPLNRG